MKFPPSAGLFYCSHFHYSLIQMMITLILFIVLKFHCNLDNITQNLLMLMVFSVDF